MGLIKQIAEELGVAKSCLRDWLRESAVKTRRTLGATAMESEEIWEQRKCNRLMAQEHVVVRCAAVYLSHPNLLGKGSTCS